MQQLKEKAPKNVRLTPGQLELIQNMVGRLPTEVELLMATSPVGFEKTEYPEINTLSQVILGEEANKPNHSNRKKLSTQIGHVYADIRKAEPKSFDPDVVAVLTGGVYDDVVARLNTEHMIRESVPHNARATASFVIFRGFSMVMGAVAANAAVRGDAKMFATGIAMSALGVVNSEIFDRLSAGRCRIAIKDFVRDHFPPIYSARAMREGQQGAYMEGMTKGADMALEAVAKSGNVFADPFAVIDIPPRQPGEYIH